MKHGKQICATLREVRKQIADANGIEFDVKECTYQGDCRGTCPKCEAELHYLENQLSLRRATGKAIVVTGIALSAMNVYAQTPSEPVASLPTQSDSTTVMQQGNFVISGKVIDNFDESVVGASILEIGTEHITSSDIDGHFTLSVNSLPVKIRVRFIGYETKECIITEENCQNAIIKLDEETTLIGEVVVISRRKMRMQKLRSILLLRHLRRR